MDWNRFEERRPDVGGFYLTFDASTKYFAVLHYSVRYQAFNAFDSQKSSKYALQVTHWCTLEAPSKGDAE